MHQCYQLLSKESGCWVVIGLFLYYISLCLNDIEYIYHNLPNFNFNNIASVRKSRFSSRDSHNTKAERHIQKIRVRVTNHHLQNTRKKSMTCSIWLVEHWMRIVYGWRVCAGRTIAATWTTANTWNLPLSTTGRSWGSQQHQPLTDNNNSWGTIHGFMSVSNNTRKSCYICC